MRLAQAQRTLEGMLDRGTGFEEAEEWIDRLSLPADHLAALWLLAWSSQPQEVQRRSAHLTLALVGGAPRPAATVQELLHRAFS